MQKGISIAGGSLLGAGVLTALHEAIRHHLSDAPRLNVLGMESLAKGLKKAGKKVPSNDNLFLLTLIGDILGNAAFYSLGSVGDRKQRLLRNVLLGASAGVGAVLLPKPLGLSASATNRTLKTKLLTVALYTAGGLATAGAIALLERVGRKK